VSLQLEFADTSIANITLN